MIYCLDGTIVKKTADEVVLSCGGVGFLAYVPKTLYAAIGEQGERALLYCYMNVKEDGIDLYGFANEQGRECFIMLISVSGVGPKAALSILSVYEPDAVAAAIAAGDHEAFCACAGIGPKIAQRITLELKSKVAGGAVYSAQSSASAEATQALIALGFKPQEAARAVSAAPAGSAEDIIRFALSNFQNRKG